MVSIRGYGSYLPLYRIERETIANQHGTRAGGGETAVPGHDENVVTLAVEAAKAALSHADVAGERLDAVFAATTSDPFDERGVAAHVAYAVGAPEAVRVADFQGSARAGTNALLAARDAVEAGRAESALVVGTDVLTADAGTTEERTAGAGAGAVVLDADGDVATLDGAAADTTGYVGRFKRADATPETGDARFNRERYLDAVSGAVEALAERVSVDPEHAVLPAPDGRWGSRALGATGFDATRHSTFEDVGFAGAASTFLDVAVALDAAGPDERLLVVSYGPGGADALALTTGAGVERLPDLTTAEYVESKEYVTYAKHRAYRERARGEA